MTKNERSKLRAEVHARSESDARYAEDNRHRYGCVPCQADNCSSLRQHEALELLNDADRLESDLARARAEIEARRHKMNDWGTRMLIGDNAQADMAGRLNRLESDLARVRAENERYRNALVNTLYALQYANDVLEGSPRVNNAIETVVAALATTTEDKST